MCSLMGIFKENEKRSIRESIRIRTSDPEYGINSIANFLSHKMKTCDAIIFQSDFGFMNSDVPFAIHIERITSSDPCCIFFKVRMIDTDWEFYKDRINKYECDLPENTHTVELDSWITNVECINGKLDPADQIADPVEFFNEMFDHYGSVDFKTPAILLCDDTYEEIILSCILKHLLREDYGPEEGEPCPFDGEVSVGGFIVYTKEKEE